MAEKLVYDARTPAGATYRGPAEVGVASFQGPPEQIVPARLMAQVAVRLEEALRGGNSPLLRVRAWADTAPTFYTRYRLEVTVAEPVVTAQAGYAAQASPFPFLVLGAVLVVLGLVALSAWQVSRIDFGGVAKVVSSPVVMMLALVVGAVILMAVLGKRQLGGQHG